MSPRQPQSPRQEIVRHIGLLYSSGLTTSLGGNLSIRDGQGRIWITPGGMDKSRLRPPDIVRIEPDGRIRSGARPSSELPMHQGAYSACPQARAVLHAHPPALVAFSIARRTPAVAALPHAWRYCGAVGCARYALPGSEALAQSVREAISDRQPIAILENHGMICAAASLEQAFRRTEVLERASRSILDARRLGGAYTLTGEQLAAWQAQEAPAGSPPAAEDGAGWRVSTPVPACGPPRRCAPAGARRPSPSAG